MLATDMLGKQREDASQPLNHRYISAFESIDQGPNNRLIIADSDGVIAGMLQLTFICYLTHVGSWRCLIEGVRVHHNFRSRGYEEAMFQYAIDVARQKGCSLVQLTSDKQRPDAISFYEKPGFVASHEGFILKLK